MPKSQQLQYFFFCFCFSFSNFFKKHKGNNEFKQNQKSIAQSILAIHFVIRSGYVVAFVFILMFPNKTKQQKHKGRVPLAGKHTTLTFFFFFVGSVFLFFFFYGKTKHKTLKKKTINQTRTQRTCTVSGTKHDPTIFSPLLY